jgi:hypothetical protein
LFGFVEVQWYWLKPITGLGDDLCGVVDDSYLLLYEQGDANVEAPPESKEEVRKLYCEGALDNRKIQMDVPDGRSRPSVEIIGGGSGFAVNELIHRVCDCSLDLFHTLCFFFHSLDLMFCYQFMS